MSDEDEVKADKMRNALSAIANEIQRLHNDSTRSSTQCGKCDNEEILHKLIKCKTSLKLRKMQVKKLRQNVKTACSVANTMSSAKAIETATLTHQLEIAKKKLMDLVQHERDQKEMINNLNIESNSLRDQLEYFNNVIQLGYGELQKMGKELVENTSTLEQLKQIVISCGQYYVDHCNEEKKYTTLEQKNRFLNNNIRIIESNLEAALEELRYLRMSRKPSNEKDIVTRTQQCFSVMSSEYKIGSHTNSFIMTKIERSNNSLRPNILDKYLSTHLVTVKNLLNDQDNLIRDLKSLTKILNNVDS